MSATSQAIPAVDLTNRANDYPAAIARNALEMAYKIAAANLVTNAAGDLATADNSATGFDRQYLVDRFLDNTLWKVAAANTAEYIVLDTGASDGSDWVDTLIVYGHNWAGQTLEVKADNSAPPVGDSWTGATTIWTGTVPTGTLYLALQAATEYKARYFRLKISGSSTVWQASQVWLGKAIQFPSAPLLPSAPRTARAGGGIVKVSEGGVRTVYPTQASLLRRSLQFLFAQAYTSQFFTDLLDLFENANALDGGTAPFWWLDTPNSDASGNAKFVFLDAPEFAPAAKADQATALALTITEQGAG